MSTVVLVDSRENGDFSKFETKTLEVGDFHIVKSGKVELVLERKIISDYAASIKDGRIAEQTFRLKECGVPVAYIIEGKIPKEVNGITGDAIKNSIMNKFIVHGISSFFTKDVSDTIDLLDRIANSVEKNSEKKSTTYVGVCKTKKSTSDNSFERMLVTIPGISAPTAANIAKKAGTLPNLIDRLRESGQSYLIGIEANGKKIGPGTAKKICEFLSI